MNYLMHYGVKGMKWGVRHDKPRSGRKRTAFVSGSSKTQSSGSPYYRKELPKPIRNALDSYARDNVKVVVGDAPGIDRQVQDYLNSIGYDNVEVYGPGKEVRYSANSKWKTNPIDAPEFEPGSKDWLAKKDKAMSNVATEGLAIVLDNGAKATRKNIERLESEGKKVRVYQLNETGKDNWVRKASRQPVSVANNYVNQHQQWVHQMEMQRQVDEAMQLSIQEANRAASLSMTYGMNPFMFG